MSSPNETLRAVARGETVAPSAVDRTTAELALVHRMAPLLLKSVDANELATEVAAPLMAYTMGVESRRGIQRSVLERIGSTLSDVGVVHTLIKGAASASRWFEEPTDRPFSDVDVVVPKGVPFHKAVVALHQLDNPAATVQVEETSAVSSVEMMIDSVRVDVQTDALRTGLVPIDYESWSVGRLQPDGDPAWRWMDDERDTILFLLHQGRDRFRFLLGVAEARLRLQSQIDWMEVERIARAEGIWEQVAVSLEVMCSELGMGVPFAMPGGWRTRLWRYLWRPRIRLLGDLGRVRHVFRGKWLMPLTMRGRFLEAVLWIFKSAFPPDAVMRIKYPNSGGPYLWRVLATRVRVVFRRRWQVLKQSFIRNGGRDSL